MTTKDEQLVERGRDWILRAGFPKTETQALITDMANAIERLEAQVKKVVIRCNALESNSLLKTTEVELAEARAETAAWERKFGGRTDYNEVLPVPPEDIES